jgi:hypothetical protein
LMLLRWEVSSDQGNTSLLPSRPATPLVEALRELTMPTNAVRATSGDRFESAGALLVGPAALI